MPVTVYTNTDAGAPAAIVNAGGSLITILDACLVNGYGSKAGAGWTKEFSGTNVAVYKQGAGSNGMCVRVDDANGPIARIRGFGVVTDVNTGTGPFPTDSQISGGGYLFKHNTGAGSRNWYVIANEKAFYFWTLYDTTTSGASAGLTFFGDIKGLMAADNFNTMLMSGWSNGSKNNSISSSPGDYAGAFSPLNVNIPGHFIARSYTQLGGSVAVGKRSESHRFNYSRYGTISSYALNWLSEMQAATVPSLVDGALYLSPMVVHEGAPKEDRGYLPGLWHVDHIPSFGVGDTFDVTEGYHAGKSFVILPVYGACFALETTNTWGN